MRLQVCKLLSRKLKCKVLWKSITISPQLLVQSLRFDFVDRRQIRIEHDTLAADQIDRAFDIVDLAKGGHGIEHLYEIIARQP